MLRESMQAHASFKYALAGSLFVKRSLLVRVGKYVKRLGAAAPGAGVFLFRERMSQLGATTSAKPTDQGMAEALKRGFFTVTLYLLAQVNEGSSSDAFVGVAHLAHLRIAEVPIDRLDKEYRQLRAL